MAKITPPRSPDPKCVSCGTPTANTYGGSPMCGSCASVARRVDDSPTTPVKTHQPCCSAHGAALDCDTYRRTHFVEVGACCDVWAATHGEGDFGERTGPGGDPTAGG